MLPTRKSFGKGKAVDRLPAGKDDRPSEDWMDFDEADGGPERTPVHGGPRPMPAAKGGSDGGIDVDGAHDPEP